MRHNIYTVTILTPNIKSNFMSTLRDQYRQQAIPLIQAAIVESRNMIDIDQQHAIRSVFPWKHTNLIAWQVWEKEVTRLRLYYYKHKRFTNV